MKKIHLGSLLTLTLGLLTKVESGQAQSNMAWEGRWDISIDAGNKTWPSWLEITHSGIRTWVGQFVGVSGSARPVSEIFVEGNKFHFAIPPQWESGSQQLKMEGQLDGEQLAGTIRMPDGKEYPFKGTRAPALKREGVPKWGKPIQLFSGKDLEGWTALGKNQWVAEKGILRSPQSGSNIRTNQSFTDFKLHLEFRYPAGSNSGVYLRGRYEVQIADSRGKEASKGEYGAVYGFIKPALMAAAPPGEWQTYDITLIGRLVTVIANGKTIIDRQEIPGITGGALDSNEGAPGPIYFQGDHGPIEYRNIILTPAS